MAAPTAMALWEISAKTPALLYKMLPDVELLTAVVPTVTRAPPDGPAGPCGPVAPIDAKICQYEAFGGTWLVD